MLLRRLDVPRPVDLARLLMSAGLTLRKAHKTVERLASGDVVALELASNNPTALISRLAALGVDARKLRVPAADPRAIRNALGLSQEEFAHRFGLGVDTVKNWEQGRNEPDPTTRVLLKVIEEYPQIVEAVLSGGSLDT